MSTELTPSEINEIYQEIGFSIIEDPVLSSNIISLIDTSKLIDVYQFVSANLSGAIILGAKTETFKNRLYYIDTNGVTPALNLVLEGYVNKSIGSYIANVITDTNVSGYIDWCQQEECESPSDCMDREYDEFVADCISCFIAYWTNPGVPLLIAAMCLC